MTRVLSGRIYSFLPFFVDAAHRYERIESNIKMLTRIAFTSTVLAALAAAAPKPQVAGYINADASFSVTEPTGSIATSFGPDSQVAVSLSSNQEYLNSNISPGPTAYCPCTCTSP